MIEGGGRTAPSPLPPPPDPYAVRGSIWKVTFKARIDVNLRIDAHSHEI